MKVFGDEIPGAVGKGDAALLPGLEVAWINGTRQIRQSFGSGSQGELGDCGRGAVAGILEHESDPLWDSVL
jgi:hypothetical protein